jgi:SPP1 family predicted phage head-tail adaptor
MRSGGLDKTIRIQSFTSVDDGAGNEIPTWSDWKTVRAQLLQASTEEFQRGWGASSEPTYIFRIRWLDGLTLVHRIIHDGTIRPIKEIKEIGRRKGLEIRTAGYGEPLEA